MKITFNKSLAFIMRSKATRSQMFKTVTNLICLECPFSGRFSMIKTPLEGLFSLRAEIFFFKN